MSETMGLLMPEMNDQGELVTQIAEENIRTGAHFQAMSIDIPMDATQGVEVIKEITFPYPVSLLSAGFYTPMDCDGDLTSFCVGADTVVGTIAADVSPDDTVFTVSETVIENTALGFYLNLFDTVKTNNLGRVIAIDAENNQVTTEVAAENSFEDANPTYVRQTAVMVPSKRLVGGQLVDIGSSKIGGSYVPAGKIIRCRYTNNSGIARTFSLDIEYLY